MLLQRCGVVDGCFGFQLKCVLSSKATIMAKLPTHPKSLFSNRNNSTINRQHRNSVTQVKRNTIEVRFLVDCYCGGFVLPVAMVKMRSQASVVVNNSL
jgi:hypothetical protein